MKVIIARHAQTNENAKQIDIGHEVDPLLTEEGLLQAQKLAKFLEKEHIHFAYVSPQKRAVHTAEEVLKFHPSAKISHEAHLKEQNLGIYESVPKHVWKELKAKSTEAFHEFKPEKGESYTELQERVKTFFGKLWENHKDDTVLIVSHGGTLGMLYLHLFDKELTEENYKAHKPDNTAVTILDIHEGKPTKVHVVNSLDHLEK